MRRLVIVLSVALLHAGTAWGDFAVVAAVSCSAGLFLSCAPTPSQIDGSSQQAYQESLAAVLKEVPEDRRAIVLEILEIKYRTFQRSFPAFNIGQDQDGNLRPPEFLALLDGLTSEALLGEAEELEQQRAEVAAEREQQLARVRREREAESLKQAAAAEERQRASTVMLSRMTRLSELRTRLGSIDKELAFWEQLRLRQLIHIEPGALWMRHQFLQVPIKIVNNADLAIFEISFWIVALEEGRDLPWIETSNVLEINAGIAPGETRSKTIVIPLGGDRLDNVLTRYKQLKLIVRPLDVNAGRGKKARIEADDPLVTLDEYDPVIVMRLQEERERLAEELDTLRASDSPNAKHTGVPNP